VKEIPSFQGKDLFNFHSLDLVGWKGKQEHGANFLM
jgi:hypothetical protein